MPDPKKSDKAPKAIRWEPSKPITEKREVLNVPIYTKGKKDESKKLLKSLGAQEMRKIDSPDAQEKSKPEVTIRTSPLPAKPKTSDWKKIKKIGTKVGRLTGSGVVI